MMNKVFYTIIVLLLQSLVMTAQGLPELPSESAIKHGVLPNGMSWYVAVNPSAKGMADFALVQRCGTAMSDSTGSAVTIAKDALAHVSGFKGKVPQKFLTSRGIAPGKDGFVKVSDDATVFRFEDILLSDDRSVTDSTLLLMFRIADRISHTDDPFIHRWYSPSSQAIVISGDVDPAKIESKLYYLSLMTPSFPSCPVPGYFWKSSGAPSFIVEDGKDGGKPSVTFRWKMPRTPDNLMNTVHTAIMEMILSELGTLASESIKDNARELGLPLGSVSWKYVQSSSTSSDETFSMTVSSFREDVPAVVDVMAGTFSSIRLGRTSEREFRDARQDFIASLSRKIAYPLKSNRDYVDRCVSAFLYNSSLASVRGKYDFYSSREIADTTELRLFNNVVSAMLSDISNLEVRCVNAVEDFDSSSLESAFMKSWDGDGYLPSVRLEENVALASIEPSADKIKITTSKTDNASRSSIWVFSNGFTVVYKQMPTDGNIFYSLSLNGGYGNIPDLVQGEGGFVSDYLGLCNINGYPADEYLASLQEQGVYMRPFVDLAEMKVSGVAPEDRIHIMLNGLTSIFYGRTANPDAYLYYRQEQEVRAAWPDARYARMAAIDSIMCPDNRYTRFKNISVLTPNTLQKAERLFSRQAEKMDDGVLILVGDMDETRLKKILLGYAGKFKTERKAFTRQKYRYQPVTGTTVYTMSGDYDCIDVVVSSQYPLTAENDAAVQIAQMVLRRRIADALAETGMYADVSLRTSIYPRERINSRVIVRKADVDGFASGVTQAGPIEALSVLRNCLSQMNGITVSDDELKAYKAYVKGCLSIEMNNPAWWLDMLSRRYIEGKDLYSNILAKVDAVTSAKVSAIFEALSHGSRVEYVVTSR